MKKGELSALTKLIIAAIVGFLLILLMFGMVIPSLSNSIDREDCRISVETMARTKVVQESPIIKDLKCNTQFVEITEKVIKKNEKIIATLNKEPEYRIKKAIADEMYDCWYQMGEGKLDPWGDWQIKPHTKHCIVCSEITFDNKAQKIHSQIKDLDVFLKKTNVPQKDFTYSDYITGGKGFAPMTLDTSSQISILYQVDDVSNIGTISGYILGGCTIGASGGAGVGALFAGVGAIPGALIGGAGGCLGGFASAIYEITLAGNHKVLLQPTIIVKKTKDITPGECELLY